MRGTKVNMNLKELNEKIIEWAKERDFENGATIEGQTIKVIEEMNRREEAILKLKLLED